MSTSNAGMTTKWPRDVMLLRARSFSGVASASDRDWEMRKSPAQPAN